MAGFEGFEGNATSNKTKRLGREAPQYSVSQIGVWRNRPDSQRAYRAPMLETGSMDQLRGAAVETASLSDAEEMDAEFAIFRLCKKH